MKDLKGSQTLHFFTSFTPSLKPLTGDRQVPYASKETLFSHEGRARRRWNAGVKLWRVLADSSMLEGMKGDRVGNMNPLTCTIVEVP